MYSLGPSTCSHTRFLLQFSYPSIIPVLPIGWRRLDHHLKTLEQLYRLVALSRHYINLLSIDSTKSTPRKQAARSKSTPNFRNFRRRVSKIAINATIDVNNSKITTKIDYKHSSASLRSPSRNTLPLMH